MSQFSHLDAEGKPTMVDVGLKNITRRIAKARAIVHLPPEVLQHFTDNDIQTKKGSVFQTAVLAGIMGAKKTSDLIPLCHPLTIENCKVDISVNNEDVIIHTEVLVSAKTGVEMEALTAASIAALTIYDMCKAFSHEIVIKEIKLLSKTGGKSDYSGK